MTTSQKPPRPNTPLSTKSKTLHTAHAERQAVQTIQRELDAVGRSAEGASLERITQGLVSDVWLVTFHDGSQGVAKLSDHMTHDLFEVEAEGLHALQATGCIHTADVLASTEQLLLLEALNGRDDSRTAWEAFADDLAALHMRTINSQFGWHRNGYLGWLPQDNSWTENGHAFFSEHRLLRYLSEPLVEHALSAQDRHAIEVVCTLLPELIPPMPAVLTHGDLWSENILSDADGRLTIIDPAVSYTWAEVDLSMLWCEPRPPMSGHFFARYQERNPSPSGWEQRMPLLHLRELLSTIAHFGGATPAINRLRQTLAPFSSR